MMMMMMLINDGTLGVLSMSRGRRWGRESSVNELSLLSTVGRGGCVSSLGLMDRKKRFLDDDGGLFTFQLLFRWGMCVERGRWRGGVDDPGAERE